MSTLTDWLKRSNAEKILLVEIDPAGSPVYLSDTAYITEPADSPANQPYLSVIAKNGIPRLTRKIQNLWGGASMSSWGNVSLATQFINGVDLAALNLRNKEVSVLLTGPRLNVLRADATQILKGVIGQKDGNADGGLNIEIRDDQSRFDDIELPPNRYDGTESASFPAANIGLSKPLCLGQCANVPAILIDKANLIYQVSDGGVAAINAVTAVYDNGISVAFTADLAAGTVTLSAAPAGVVTADVQGVVESSVWLSSTTQIIDWLARVYGGLVSADIDITGLPGETVGIYLNNSIVLSDIITPLMQGLIGWWGFTRNGVLRARLTAEPVTGGPVFDATKHLSDLTWIEDPDIFWSVPILYGRNFTPGIQPAASVALDVAEWFRSDGYVSRVEDATIKTTYLDATTAKRIESYFVDKAPADTVANRGLVLFGTLRRRARVALPVTEPMLELGDSLELADADILNGDHLIINALDIWDAEIPKTDAEVWA